MKKPSLLLVIMIGVCAIIRIIKAISEVVYPTHSNSVFWFVFYILCAVIWIAFFVVNLKSYRSNKEDKED